MTIAPIVQSVEVKTPPGRTFDLFAGDIAAWWPKGQTIGKKPHVDLVMEPRPGGRWYERDEDGAECDWGQVLAWEPPARILLMWQLDSSFTFNPAVTTEVELTFAPAPGGGTRVTLEHRKLESLGETALKTAESLKGGWMRKLEQFADYLKETVQ